MFFRNKDKLSEDKLINIFIFVAKSLIKNNPQDGSEDSILESYAQIRVQVLQDPDSDNEKRKFVNQYDKLEALMAKLTSVLAELVKKFNKRLKSRKGGISRTHPIPEEDRRLMSSDNYRGFTFLAMYRRLIRRSPTLLISTTAPHKNLFPEVLKSLEYLGTCVSPDDFQLDILKEVRLLFILITREKTNKEVFSEKVIELIARFMYFPF